MKSFKILICVTAVVIAGCSTPEERAAQRAAERERLERMFAAACTSYGHEEGTQAFNQCVAQEERAYESEKRIAAAEAKARSAARKAEEIESNRDYECIMSGGVPGYGTCW